MKRITFDFETRSLSDLKKEGPFKYSLDSSTQPTCLSAQIHWESTILFLTFEEVNRQWHNVPQQFRNVWKECIDKGYEFSAHNAGFETVIYKNILVKRYGWPDIPFRQFRCTAAKAAACSLPRSLEGAGIAMELKTQKDKLGYAAVMATCKPTRQYRAWVKKGKIGPAPPLFLEPWADPQTWMTLYRYNQIDVRAEVELDSVLPDLSKEEQEVWFLNQQINWRGVQVDVRLISKIIAIIESETVKGLKEMDVLTNGLVTKPGARQAILDFLAAEGVKAPNLQAKTVQKLLESKNISQEALELLQLRKALTKTSTKKYQAFLNRASGGKIRDILMYHGAHTGRDTGTGVQFQNLPKPLISQDDIESVIKLLNDF